MSEDTPGNSGESAAAEPDASRLVPTQEVEQAYGEARDRIERLNNGGGSPPQGADRGLQARAFAELRDVIFGVQAGQQGETVAHELAHVVQQGAQRLGPGPGWAGPEQVMMRPEEQRTRADANLILSGRYPAQMPVISRRTDVYAYQYGYQSEQPAQNYRAFLSNIQNSNN